MTFVFMRSARSVKEICRGLFLKPADRIRKIFRLGRDVFYIKRSGLFDSDWYLLQYKDVADAGVHPLIHYVCRGIHEGRNPNPLFDVDWYLYRNPGLNISEENPLVHYIRNGAPSGKNPSAYFDAEWYVSQYGDAKKSAMHPLRHYLEIGAVKGYRPIPGASLVRNSLEACEKENRPRLLMMDQFYPRPNRDSGSIDCMNYIKIFKELGYQVFFASVGEYNAASEVFKELEENNVQCLNPGDYLTIEAFVENEMQGFSAAFLSRVFSGGRFVELIRKRNPEARLIFNPVDLHAVREVREAELLQSQDGMKKALKTAERERYLVTKCDATIVVSGYEKKLLESEVPGARVIHVPLMRDCPGRGRTFHERSGICFIGSYRHSPNIDALRYFLESIWDLILGKIPDAKFYIIGSGLPENLRNLMKQNIVVLGHVSDLSECLDGMRLSIAPLRYGAGAKGKVASSLAHGLPCVATSIAVEGTGLVKDQHIAVENDPINFADRVVEIYRDQDLWVKLSDEGQRFCVENFSYAAGSREMSKLFQILGLAVADEKQE